MHSVAMGTCYSAFTALNAPFAAHIRPGSEGLTIYMFIIIMHYLLLKKELSRTTPQLSTKNHDANEVLQRCNTFEI